MSDEDGAVEFSGRLTESEYARWFRTESFYKDDNHGSLPKEGFSVLQDSRIDREFECLRQSEFILDHFFNIPALFRKCVSDYASVYCSLPVMEAFVRLASKVPEVEDNNFELESVVDIMYCYEDTLFDESSIQVRGIFNGAMYGLLKLYDSSENSNCTRMIVSMLSCLYGTDFVVDIIQWWKSAGGVPGSVTAFVTVVENWKPEFKGLPSHWVANVISDESAA